MTGPEHYREAERLLALADDDSTNPFLHAQKAQVHATLALTAATANQTSVTAFAHDINDSDVDAWLDAAGTKPEGGASNG